MTARRWPPNASPKPWRTARIYLGIESLTGEFLPDKGGYLYVINCEQYADGTFGLMQQLRGM